MFDKYLERRPRAAFAELASRQELSSKSRTQQMALSPQILATLALTHSTRRTYHPVTHHEKIHEHRLPLRRRTHYDGISG
jgi:hypothetical protein